jgi:hypothetical protein
MERVSVNSSYIASIGYDASTMTLEIQFRNGSIYQYYGVPAEVYEGLMNAGSKGSYFHHHIKGASYPCAKVG